MKQTADNNRHKIIPDKLKNGIREFMHDESGGEE
jgi:hypothetical protein